MNMNPKSVKNPKGFKDKKKFPKKVQTSKTFYPLKSKSKHKAWKPVVWFAELELLKTTNQSACSAFCSFNNLPHNHVPKVKGKIAE